MGGIHNAIKYGTDILRAYSRAVGLGEEEEGTVRLGETLTPVMDVWSLPEWAFLRGETLWADNNLIVAVAAEFGFGGVRNPTGSRRVVVVKELVVSTPGATIKVEYRRGVIDADGVDATDNVVTLDTRSPSTVVTVPLTLRGAHAVPIGSGPYYKQTATATADAVNNVPVILLPGQELRVYGGTVNVAFEFSAWGTVRFLQPGELGT